MKIEKLNMTCDEAVVTLRGTNISTIEYRTLAVAEYNKDTDLIIISQKDLDCIRAAASIEPDFTDDELHLMALAINEMLGMLNLESRICSNYRLLAEKVHKIRAREEIKNETV